MYAVITIDRADNIARFRAIIESSPIAVREGCVRSGRGTILFALSRGVGAQTNVTGAAAGCQQPATSRRPRAEPPSPFRCFNSSPKVIRLVVLMYVRFPLSLRNVEDLLAERGIDLCHETVRFWWNRFGPLFAADIRR